MSLMANEFLYHGSNQVIEHPICDMGAKGRDFGVCFYTTYSKKRPNYNIIIGPMADRGLKEQFMKMRMEHLTFAEIAPLIHYDKFKSMQVCFCIPYAISILNHLG